MTSYKILEINKDQGWIKIEVKFEDGEVYQKRMMAPLDSPESINAAVCQWLADYLPQRSSPPQLSKHVQSMVNTNVVVDVDKLPKTSKQVAIEQEAAKEAELIKNKPVEK